VGNLTQPNNGVIAPAAPTLYLHNDQGALVLSDDIYLKEPCAPVCLENDITLTPKKNGRLAFTRAAVRVSAFREH
jgi:hypothetical protein